MSKKKEESVKIFDLVVKSKSLPARLDELVPLSFIGAAAVKFYKAKVQVMKELGMADAQQKATLADGQDAAECLLRIEARIGELLPSPAEARIKGGKARHGQLITPQLPAGMTSQRAYHARKIAAHPKEVDAIIAQAKENEDLPTRTAVLNKIAYDEDKHYKQNVRLQRDAEMHSSEVAYLISLEQAYKLIAKAPRQITEVGHAAIVDGLKKIAEKIGEMLHEEKTLLE